MFYLELIRRLQEENVRFLVAGNLALVLYGVPRKAEDIDLILDLEQENIRRFLGVMTSLGFTPTIEGPPSAFADSAERAKWWTRKTWEVVFREKDRPLVSISDFLHSTVPFEQLYQRCRKVRARDGFTEIPLLSEKDLVARMIRSGTDRDLRDAEVLRKKLKANEERGKERP